MEILSSVVFSASNLLNVLHVSMSSQRPVPLAVADEIETGKVLSLLLPVFDHFPTTFFSNTDSTTSSLNFKSYRRSIVFSIKE